MNCEQLVNVAEAAIGRCTDHTDYRYNLCVRNGTLICVPRRLAEQDDVLVMHLTRGHMNNGLTFDEWNTAGKKLLTIWKGLKI